MNRSCTWLTLALTPLAMIFLAAAPALAQSPPAATSEKPSAPAAPAPTPPAPDAPSPATPPAAAGQTTEATEPADPFGEEVTLAAKKVVMVKGSAKWDAAFETITRSAKTLTALLGKETITAAGPLIVVYTSTDDAGFTYQVEIPVDQDPKNLAKDMSIGTSPEGRMLKFVHRGSYDNMDNTYEAITNHLDAQKLEAKDTFVEEYVTDPLKTAEDKLVINVYVPLQ